MQPTTEESSDTTESGLGEEGQGSDPTIEEVPQPEVQAPLTSESVSATVLDVCLQEHAWRYAPHFRSGFTGPADCSRVRRPNAEGSLRLEQRWC